ncbi:MAG TPA: hypothetical protein VIA81_07960 [Acidimicrobiia bacterium]|jgi:hypothetical protein
MRRWLRVAFWCLAGLVVLVGLFFLFEWAGDLLDSGGAISG